MTALGIDYSTKYVDFVYLSDDGRADWHRLDIRAADAFEAARKVRAVFQNAPFAVRNPLYERVHVVGIEDSGYRSTATVRALARVQGAIVASLPRELCVVPLAAQEWKKQVLGRGNASKDDVRAWSRNKLFAALVDDDDWPQDAHDAHLIARAVLALTEQKAA